MSRNPIDDGARPCPFCGGEAELAYVIYERDDGYCKCGYIYCRECGAAGADCEIEIGFMDDDDAVFAAEKEALAWWNGDYFTPCDDDESEAT